MKGVAGRAEPEVPLWPCFPGLALMPVILSLHRGVDLQVCKLAWVTSQFLNQGQTMLCDEILAQVPDAMACPRMLCSSFGAFCVLQSSASFCSGGNSASFPESLFLTPQNTVYCFQAVSLNHVSLSPFLYWKKKYQRQNTKTQINCKSNQTKATPIREKHMAQ